MSEEVKDPAVRERGTVKLFSGTFGFICRNGDRGDSLFVHFKNIVDTGVFRTLKQSESVSFEVEEGPKGPQCVRVVPDRLAQSTK